MNETRMAETVLNNSYHIGKKQIANVPVELLSIDYNYQRVATGKVKQLASDWEDDECRFLVTNYRDGKFYVIDGQHRALAAERLGITDLPCEIFVGLTESEEALLFARQNRNMTRLTPMDTFRANVMNGDMSIPDVKVDMCISELCGKYCYTTEKTSKPRNVHAVSVCRKIVKAHGKQMLDNIFQVLHETGWENNKMGFRTSVLQALCNTLNDMDLDVHSVVSHIGDKTPMYFLGIGNTKYPHLSEQMKIYSAIKESEAK